MHDMTDGGYARKFDELDRLLNDPDVPMQPDLVWRLLDEMSELLRAASEPRDDRLAKLSG
jgi:hypothetical protein